MRMFSRLSAAAAFVATLSAFTVATAEELWQTLPPEPAMPAATETGTADVNGAKIYYAVYGTEGDPVLLLHGGMGHSDVWGNQIPALLGAGHKVIAIDSRGHGRSTRDEQQYSYALMAGDVLGVMDHLGVERASIVGWSDGGIIGLEIAINHPERLNKLFAFGANYNVSGVNPNVMESPVFSGYIDRAGEDYKRMSSTPDEYDAFVEQISAMWFREPDYSAEQLGSITAPTAIVDGEHDEGILRAHTEEMAKLIPGAKLIILPNVSHFAFWQDPELFNKTMLEFLDGA